MKQLALGLSVGPGARALFVSVALSSTLCACTASVALEELPEERTAVTCAEIEGCLPADIRGALGLSGDVCDTVLGGQAASDNALLAELIERGTVTYDGAAAANCLEELELTECTLFIDLPVVCDDVFVGTVEIGGDCSVSEECEGDAYCLSPLCPDQAGTCTQRQTSGTACDFDDQCSSGLVCEDGTCRTSTSTSGGQCEGGTDLSCPIDQVCVGADGETAGTCTPWDSVMTRGMGDPCNLEERDLCVPGLSCALTAVGIGGATFECEARVGAGEACHIGLPNQCPETHYCDASPPLDVDGTCLPLPAAGENCLAPTSEFQPRCAAGLRCNSDGNCVAPVANGGTCTGNEVCFSGYCDDGTCQPRLCP
jgi:hypothetical protein